MNKSLPANLAAAAAALSAGGAVVATRFVIGETEPATLAFYRYIIALVCLAPFMPLIWPRGGIAGRDLVKIGLLGAIFFGAFPWAFNASLQYTPAARGAIGLATIPIQTLVVAALFGREELTRNKIASVALAFVGIAIVFGPQAMKVSGADYLIGDAFMLLGAFCAAIYSVFSRSLLTRYGPMFVTALAMLSGLIALLPLAAAHGAVSRLPAFSTDGWLALLFLGTLAGAVQFSLFTWALRWLAPTRTVIYLTLNPISAMLLAVMILGESLTLTLITGLLFVISGILVANLPPRGLRKSRAASDPARA